MSSHQVNHQPSQSNFPQSQSCGGLGNYSRTYTSQQPQNQSGLASYGQSLSSENIDFNNLSAYPAYSQPYNGGPQYGACGGGPNQFDVNDPHLLQQVDQIVASLTECKRPMLRRQVITVPSSCPGRVSYISRRLPTPPPDIIERITVIKPPRDVVNLCIEKPYQPGPCYQERNICGKPRKPIIQPRVITVPPRSNPCQPEYNRPPHCPPCPPCPPCPEYNRPPHCPPCPPCPPCPDYNRPVYSQHNTQPPQQPQGPQPSIQLQVQYSQDQSSPVASAAVQAPGYQSAQTQAPQFPAQTQPPQFPAQTQPPQFPAQSQPPQFGSAQTQAPNYQPVLTQPPQFSALSGQQGPPQSQLFQQNQFGALSQQLAQSPQFQQAAQYALSQQYQQQQQQQQPQYNQSAQFSQSPQFGQSAQFGQGNSFGFPGFPNFPAQSPLPQSDNNSPFSYTGQQQQPQQSPYFSGQQNYGQTQQQGPNNFNF